MNSGVHQALCGGEVSLSLVQEVARVMAMPDKQLNKEWRLSVLNSSTEYKLPQFACVMYHLTYVPIVSVRA